MMRPSNQTLFWLALAQELQGLAIAIHDMHQAAGEAQRAAHLADAIRSELAPVAARLDDEHAAADPNYAEARQALRLAQAGQAPVRDITRRPHPPPQPPSRLRARTAGTSPGSGLPKACCEPSASD
jgi:hypothetical protein